MLKKLLQAQDVSEAANEPTASAVGPANDLPADNFKSFEEQIQELDEHLTQRLKEHEQLKAAKDELAAIQAGEILAQQAGHSEPIPDPDQSTQEFIQLADFISKERNKKASSKDPTKIEKIGKLQKYARVKTKEFESLERQKGLQINKAA